MIPDISLPNVTEISSTEKQGSFVIEPLWPGYGQTIGNSLRRVLLSSLPGAAITALMIDGASHEFTTIPGVEEDVVELILRLKQLRFSVEGDEAVLLELDVKGPKEVTAEDFKKDSRIVIANPELVIAHLGAKAQLKLQATVSTGRGFSSSEDRNEEEQPNRVTFDAHFSPVTHVNFEVENTRVGDVTNFDKLVLSITTDGSLSPKEALRTAANILIDHFKLFAPSEAVGVEEPEKPKRSRKSKSE